MTLSPIVDRAFVGLFLPGDHAKQRGLAGAVRADHADDAARRQFEREIVDQQLVAETLGEIGEIDDIVAEPLGDRDDDLRRRRRVVGLLVDEVLVALDARLGLGLPRLGRGADPFGFLLDLALARRVLALLEREALRLLLQVGSCNCLRAGCRGRGRVRESSPSHCRGNSGRG